MQSVPDFIKLSTMSVKVDTHFVNLGTKSYSYINKNHEEIAFGGRKKTFFPKINQSLTCNQCLNFHKTTDTHFVNLRTKSYTYIN